MKISGGVQFVLLLLALLLWVWVDRPRPWPKPPSDLKVAEVWLECIDCRGSFLRRMRHMSAKNRDTVTQFLRKALLSGPDTTRLVRLHRDLLRVWQADSIRIRRARPKAPGLTVTPGPGAVIHVPSADTQRAAFISHYRNGFEVTYRRRAAIALGIIETPAARAALEEALRVRPKTRKDSAVYRVVERVKADTADSVLGYYP